MKPLSTRVLALVALFEGSAGGKINVWDEQLLSLGTMHFAVGQGSGVRFLQRVYQLDAAGTLACLGPDFTAAIKAGPQALTAFCRARVWRSGETWTNAFKALSRLDAYATADAEACRPYLQGGQGIARRYGLTSERGLAFAVDRAVQQGWGVREAVERAYQSAKGKSEEDVMVALTLAYANSANPTYRQTVLRRALTVARGGTSFTVGATVRRTGYPGDFNLSRDFGLSAARGWVMGPGDVDGDGVPDIAPGVPRVFLTDTGGTVRLWDGKDTGAGYAGLPVRVPEMVRLAGLVEPGASKIMGAARVTRYLDGALHLERV